MKSVTVFKEIFMINIFSIRLAIIIGIIVIISGCASTQSDPEPTMSDWADPNQFKPQELGQCSIISRGDTNDFDVAKNSLIGKRYAIYSKARKDSIPQGPYILRQVSFVELTKDLAWWQMKFNDKQIDLAETFIETSKGTFENFLLLNSPLRTTSCDSQKLIYQKKILLN
jgi:hypothetical protein